MKAVDLREMGDPELRAELQELLRSLMGARVRQATQTLTNHVTLRSLRRDIARVRTVMAERQRAGAAAASAPADDSKESGQ
ncbi:MAG: 50S ribosomal protein L29 [Betaproteobacteria bacterium]|nr:50S ribosomal protein L29 [Betaproteobacteria bacterium]